MAPPEEVNVEQTRVFGVLAATLLALVAAVPASALPLTVSSAQSSIVPEAGAAQSLSGTIEVAIGSLPLTQTTTFDVIGLAVSASGGASFGLDPASPSPGLGVVNVAGAFLIPTLFLAVDLGGGGFPLAISNVTGRLGFDPSGSVLTGLTTTFQVASGGPAGLLTVTLVAVPEPGSLALAGAGLLALAARARGTRREVAR